MGTHNFEISATVLNHLGRQLYRNFITVIGEAISNAWDANANNVWITIDYAANEMFIADDGNGMNDDDLQNKFLKIGYSKRLKGMTLLADPVTGRPYIGAKGIGKLALLSCARQVSVVTTHDGHSISSCLIDNDAIDAAIQDDDKVTDISLPEGSPESIDHLKALLNPSSPNQNRIEHGTVVHFDGLYPSRNTEEFLRKALALSYRFALVDPGFSIYLNGVEVGPDDLASLRDATQYVWTIGDIDDPFLEPLEEQIKKVSASSESCDFTALETLGVKGFVASVNKPRDLAIYGTKERASIDIYVNGRLREANVMQRIPTSRVPEQYFYGQLHLNYLEKPGSDPYVSSREGIRGDDPDYITFLDIFSSVIGQISNQWDELRRQDRQDGDPDNTTRVTKLQRKNEEFTREVIKTFTPTTPSKEHRQRLKKAEAGLEVALDHYSHLYVTENLMRQSLIDEGCGGDEALMAHDQAVYNGRHGRRSNEHQSVSTIGLSGSIRADDRLLYYLDFPQILRYCESSGIAQGKFDSLTQEEREAIRLLRNVVMHTCDLTQPAREHFAVVISKLRAIMQTE